MTPTARAYLLALAAWHHAPTEDNEDRLLGALLRYTLDAS